MARQVNLTISNDLYDQAERIAQQYQRDVNEVLAEAIELSDDQEQIIDWTEPNEDMDREMAAYLAMHAELWKKYPGQYVAVNGGQLVDRDINLHALWQRIDAQYPDEFVWVSQVKEEPIQIFRVPC